MNGYPIATPVPPPPTAPGADAATRPFNYASYPSYSKPHQLNASQISQLKTQGFSRGSIDILSQATDYFPLRYWVVDNSGSMNKTDGNRLIPTRNNTYVKMVPCTRWKELQETVEYHSQLSGLLHAPTSFCLLNNPGGAVGPQEFSIADKGPEMIPSDLQLAKRTMTNASPSGVTPLSDHVHNIRQMIAAMADDLRSEGRRVAVILATDGLPTDASGIGGYAEKELFIQALRSLEGLPCWIVVRLCTDEDDVVEFYNNLDQQLELSIEVLDDFTSEAKEVYKVNPWLNYTLPLHRMREMGTPNRLFDLLDERRFTKSELRDFCTFLFGNDEFDGVPEPEVDWSGFITAVQGMLKKEGDQFNSIKEKPKPLLDLKAMHRMYGDSSSCSIM